MKVAFDTSALVPALIATDSRHSRAILWLESAATGRIQGVAGWHAMAETWAVLTRMPLQPRLSGTRAREVVAKLEERLELVEPSADLYRRALERCAARGLFSGAVFDALHLVSAEIAGAAAVLTFNPRDFERLALSDSDAPRIVVPPDPPSLDLG